MYLTPEQLPALKAVIIADAALMALPNTPDGNTDLSRLLNLTAAPDFWVWRTSVTEEEYTGLSGVDVANAGNATNWSWPIFITRSVGERDGWSRMFATGFINPSRSNVRTGIIDIFSGTAGAAQRNHLAVLSKRRATRGEKIYATGSGTFLEPATLVFEGEVFQVDVGYARAL